jgi:hypothetical protein
MIYYFRQPNPKVEEYELYSNTSLTRVGEVLLNKYYIGNAYQDVIWAVNFLNDINN